MAESPRALVSRGAAGHLGGGGGQEALTELLSWAVLVRMVRDTKAQREGGPVQMQTVGREDPGRRSSDPVRAAGWGVSATLGTVSKHPRHAHFQGMGSEQS